MDITKTYRILSYFTPFLHVYTYNNTKHYKLYFLPALLITGSQIPLHKINITDAGSNMHEILRCHNTTTLTPNSISQTTSTHFFFSGIRLWWNSLSSHLGIHRWWNSLSKHLEIHRRLVTRTSWQAIVAFVFVSPQLGPTSSTSGIVVSYFTPTDAMRSSYSGSASVLWAAVGAKGL